MFNLGVKEAAERMGSRCPDGQPRLPNGKCPPRRKSKYLALGIPPMRPPSRVPSETSEEEKKQNETHGAPDTDVASGDEAGLMPQRGTNRMKTASMSVTDMQRIADRNRRKRDTGIRPDGTPPGGNQSGIDPGNDNDLYRRYGKGDAMVDPGFPQNLVTPGSNPGQGTGEMNTPFDKLSFDLGVRDMLEKLAVKAEVNDELIDAAQAQMVEASPEQVIATLPKPEAFMRHVEDSYGKLPKKVLERALKSMTIDQLAKHLAKMVLNSTTSKVAAMGMSNPFERQKRHKAYMTNRFRHIQRSRMYRMGHKAQIARKKKKYRRQVAMKARRPKKRMGSAGGGYFFMAR